MAQRVEVEEIHAEAGFALPAVFYEWCEKEGAGYIIGLVVLNPPRLQAIAEPLLERAERELGEEREGEKVRLVADTPYPGRVAGIDPVVGWCTRPRRWRREQTHAAWSSPAARTTGRRNSTTGTL